MPRLKGSADLLEDRRRRALALWDTGLSLGPRPRSCAIGIMEPKKEHLDFHPQICRAPKLAGKTLGFLHPSDAWCTMRALGPFPGEENHEPS